jgi:hypothetical protein
MVTEMVLSDPPNETVIGFLRHPDPGETGTEAALLAARIAERAANLITRYGWTQGRYGNTETGMCCMGALQMALDQLTGPEDFYDFDALFYETRRAFWHAGKVLSIPTWNDALPESNGQQIVVQTLKSVAAYLAMPR